MKSLPLQSNMALHRSPMLNVYVNGEVVKTIIGAKPKPALLKELEAFI